MADKKVNTLDDAVVRGQELAKENAAKDVERTEALDEPTPVAQGTSVGKGKGTVSDSNKKK